MPYCTTGSARFLQALGQWRSCFTYFPYDLLFFFFLSGKGPALRETMWSIPIGPKGHHWRNLHCNRFESQVGCLILHSGMPHLVTIKLYRCFFLFICGVRIPLLWSGLFWFRSFIIKCFMGEKNNNKDRAVKHCRFSPLTLFCVVCHSSCPRRLTVLVCCSLFLCTLHNLYASREQLYWLCTWTAT